MVIENLHQAIALEGSILGDFVSIIDGHCYKIPFDGSGDIYYTVDKRVSVGQIANLAGQDTIFNIPVRPISEILKNENNKA